MLPAVTHVRPMMIDSYVSFIHATLEKYPTLTASRLYDMTRERGYPGGRDHFRHVLSRIRPRKPAEAFLRLSPLAGTECQADWGHFSKISIDGTQRPLMALVMVLSYSRDIFLRFFLNARTESFLRGHVEAFERWAHVPRTILYDNLKSAVLERVGDAIHFNPKLLEFAGHYRFEPRPVGVRRGNEKGRVERAIRFIRSAFIAGRTITTLDALNSQATEWCLRLRTERRWPQDDNITVADALAHEQTLMLPLPDNPFVVEEQVPVVIGKTPYARFDGNDYSVPHTHVHRTLMVRADLDQVRLFDGADMVASHPRSYGRHRFIEDQRHVADLVEQKQAAHQSRGVNTLIKLVPACQELLERAAERGAGLGGITTMLLRLLDLYGAEELHVAVSEAVQAGASHTNTVRYILERRRGEQHQPPPVAVPLPDHVVRKDVSVKPHRLESYDKLTKVADDDQQ
jgi:transposase